MIGGVGEDLVGEGDAEVVDDRAGEERGAERRGGGWLVAGVVFIRNVRPLNELIDDVHPTLIPTHQSVDRVGFADLIAAGEDGGEGIDGTRIEYGVGGRE